MAARSSLKPNRGLGFSTLGQEIVDCGAGGRKLKGQLARKRKKRIVYLVEVRVNPIVARAPSRCGFIGPEADYCKIVRGILIIAQVREAFSNISGRVLADDPFTLIHGKNCSQYALVLCVGLAKVEVWHDEKSSIIP